MAPRSKIQRSKAGQTKRTQRQRMAEYGLQEVTVYVPKDEAEGLRSRSSKLVAAARAKSVLDSMNKEDAIAIEALCSKDYSQFKLTKTSGSDEPHNDRNAPNTTIVANTSAQTSQIQPSRLNNVVSATTTDAPFVAPAPTRSPPSPVQPKTAFNGALQEPQLPPERRLPTDDEMTAMLAKANGLMHAPTG